MNELVIPRSHEKETRPSLGERLARNLVRRQLNSLKEGAITLRDGSEELVFGDAAAPRELRAVVSVHRPEFYTRLVRDGGNGVAEAFVDGAWSCDDLTALLRVVVRNMSVNVGLDRGWARLAAVRDRVAHLFRRNTRGGSRRNIAAHYDLSNEFFAELLDETMNYSSAYFESSDQSLRDASVAKMERICRKLDLGPGDHLLEIGTGWGALAAHAAANYGCRVTTTTVSHEQFQYARRRVAAAGLEDRVTVLESDYRDLEGRYDKIVSVEMIEAVGAEYYGTFFEKCMELLEPHGRMLLQAITIGDRHFERARREADFIKKHIFPGCCIPSLGALQTASVRTDLDLVDVEDIGLHYARTLAEWRRNLNERAPRIRRLGFDGRFSRLWNYYLCYCEAGFLERHIRDLHLVYSRPRDAGHLAREVAR